MLPVVEARSRTCVRRASTTCSTVARGSTQVRPRRRSRSTTRCAAGTGLLRDRLDPPRRRRARDLRAAARCPPGCGTCFGARLGAERGSQSRRRADATAIPAATCRPDFETTAGRPRRPALLPAPEPRDGRLVLQLRPPDLPRVHDPGAGRLPLPGVRRRAARGSGRAPRSSRAARCARAGGRHAGGRAGPGDQGAGRHQRGHVRARDRLRPPAGWHRRRLSTKPARRPGRPVHAVRSPCSTSTGACSRRCSCTPACSTSPSTCGRSTSSARISSRSPGAAQVPASSTSSRGWPATCCVLLVGARSQRHRGRRLRRRSSASSARCSSTPSSTATALRRPGAAAQHRLPARHQPRVHVLVPGISWQAHIGGLSAARPPSRRMTLAGRKDLRRAVRAGADCARRRGRASPSSWPSLVARRSRLTL